MTSDDQPRVEVEVEQIVVEGQGGYWLILFPDGSVVERQTRRDVERVIKARARLRASSGRVVVSVVEWR